MVKREENNRFPRRASFETPLPRRLCTTGERGERRRRRNSFPPSSSIFSHSTLVFLPSSRPFCFFSSLFLSTYSVELLPNERQETSSYPTISFPHLGPRRAPSATRTSFFSLSLSLSLLPRLLSARVLLLCRMYIREAMEVPRGQPIAPGRTLQPRASAAD